MLETSIIEVGRQTIEVTLTVALPLLAVSLAIGLAVSLFQVATSLQDVTLSFVPKILAVALVLVLTGTWMLQVLVSYTHSLFARIPEFVQ